MSKRPDVIGIDNLKKDLESLRKRKVTIGFQGESGSAIHENGDGASVANVASWMEYGTESVPARPFLRTTFSRYSDKFQSALKKAVSDLIDRRKSLETALEPVGELGVASVRDIIDTAATWAEPLSAGTVKSKGHSSPLVDTGQMRATVSWAIRDDNKIINQGGEE
jgi:hypothetical protein